MALLIIGSKYGNVRVCSTVLKRNVSKRDKSYTDLRVLFGLVWPEVKAALWCLFYLVSFYCVCFCLLCGFSAIALIFSSFNYTCTDQGKLTRRGNPRIDYTKFNFGSMYEAQFVFRLFLLIFTLKPIFINK